MDVHKTFLHGDLEEEACMKILLGFQEKNDYLLCRKKHCIV